MIRLLNDKKFFIIQFLNLFAASGAGGSLIVKFDEEINFLTVRIGARQSLESWNHQ